MAKDKYIGIASKDNFAGWADYAKGKATCDKRRIEAEFGTEVPMPIMRPMMLRSGSNRSRISHEATMLFGNG